jgi:VanZ family protein
MADKLVMNKRVCHSVFQVSIVVRRLLHENDHPSMIPTGYTEFMRKNLTLMRVLFIAAIACWLAIILGTHLPSQQVPPTLSAQDKLLHFAAYAVLTFLVVSCWRLAPRPVVRFSMLLAFVILVLHAALDEATQRFVPGRAPEVGDWLADLLGVLTGLGLAQAALRWTRPAVSSAVNG